MTIGAPAPPPRVESALDLARTWHAGQLDKAGRPYIEHPMAVASLLDTEDDKVVGLLHDILEDTDCPPAEILARFGPEVLADVIALTHRAGESRDEYLRRVRRHGGRAVRVKMADIRHNTDGSRLALLDHSERARLEDKYRSSAEALGTSLPEIHHRFAARGDRLEHDRTQGDTA